MTDIKWAKKQLKKVQKANKANQKYIEKLNKEGKDDFNALRDGLIYTAKISAWLAVIGREEEREKEKSMKRTIARTLDNLSESAAEAFKKGDFKEYRKYIKRLGVVERFVPSKHLGYYKDSETKIICSRWVN